MTFRAPSSVILTAAIMALAGALVTGCKTLEGKDSENKATATKAPAQDWNAAIVSAVEKLPIGGGYAVSVEAKDALQAAVAWEDGKPVLRPGAAQPSFCSGATYLAFVIALAQEQKAGRLSLTPTVWRKLVVEGQGDGEGVWGRWNANGPGTARLFHELGLGHSFTDWQEARTGDFLKLFWNDSIGAEEKGHSVIYIERGVMNGEDVVAFWSSNQPGGFGVKQVPFSKIKRAIFTRLEHPERLSEVAGLPAKDGFLASLLEKSVTPEAAAKACGLRKL
ncbi:MAG: hypothetical protein WCO60_12110 [Verrucomicrobiota bacterium]